MKAYPIPFQAELYKKNTGLNFHRIIASDKATVFEHVTYSSKEMHPIGQSR